jgi:hypothetical protein
VASKGPSPFGSATAVDEAVVSGVTEAVACTVDESVASGVDRAFTEERSKPATSWGL